MSKEATIIQSFNDIKQQYEYSVKGYDVTESVKILLKTDKESYDKEKKIFAGIDGYLEAQTEYQSQIADLQSQLAEKDKEIANIKGLVRERDKQIKNLKTNKKRVVEHKNKAKINFAIEQLEKVKEIMSKSNESGYIIRFTSMNDREKFNETIDNQIKAIKEMKYAYKRNNQ